MEHKTNTNIDLTVITNVVVADGIGRQGIGLLTALHDRLRINAMQLPPKTYKDVPKEALKILIKPFDGFGKVAFWTYILGLNEEAIPVHAGLKSEIKMAYSMFESDAIPDLWVKILNSHYDMVVVPDPYLVSVYKNSGVKIPIFVVPLGIMVENLLAKPTKTKANEVFTFGLSAGFWKRKNHIKVLEAFGKKFGNDPNFKLKLHGRFGSYRETVTKAVADANLSNVELISAPLSPTEYDNFMEQIDCYVFPSMGEGFSITPRETMALGKPCIVSNNSCHKTICDSGFVIPLRSEQKVPAYYEVFGKNIGNNFDCDTQELIDTMSNVVDNYDTYLARAQGGREWVKQYLWSSLAPTYVNLIRPKNVTLGDSNLVTEQVFQTKDKVLFAKLKKAFKS